MANLRNNKWKAAQSPSPLLISFKVIILLKGIYGTSQHLKSSTDARSQQILTGTAGKKELNTIIPFHPFISFRTFYFFEQPLNSLVSTMLSIVMGVMLIKA